jgi:heme exporter protein B
MGEFFRDLLTLVSKDLKLELRSKEILASIILYTILASVIFAYAFDKVPKSNTGFYVGVLWVAITFAGTLAMGRLASREEENQALLGLVLAPSSHTALYFSKVIVAFLLMALLSSLAVPVFAFLFSVSMTVTQALGVLLSIWLGALGFSLVGSITSSALVATKGRELLMPVALYPLSLPVIIAGASTTYGMLGTSSMVDTASSGLQILIVFNLVYAIVGGNLYEYLLVD